MSNNVSWLIVTVTTIIITILVIDIYEKNAKIEKLNKNIINLYQENITIKNNLAVAKCLLEYVSD